LQPKLANLFVQLGIKTFVFDSVTSCCICLRNKFAAEGTHDPDHPNLKIEDSARGWANRATDELEWVNQFINSLTINTCTICHSSYDTNPNRNPDLPAISVHAYGRMKDRFLITSGDVYQTFIEGGQHKVHVTADALRAGNNSMKLTGTFPNDWKEIVKADKTKVTFVKRERE
jgi:hypothetical protein